jgi:hypothetical protein
MGYDPDSGITAQTLQAQYVNGTGLTIAKASPVSVDTGGHIVPTDVTSEVSVYRIVGLTELAVAGGMSGYVVDAGRLQNVVTGFGLGDPIYVSATGGLTNLKPQAGSNGFAAGDWVVFVGILVANQINPILFDIKLMLSIVGQL